MSRGFSEKQAKRLIISANLTKIINNIPDELIKEEVNEYLEDKNIEELADVMECKSMAFPLLASGNNKFDKSKKIKKQL